MPAATLPATAPVVDVTSTVSSVPPSALTVSGLSIGTAAVSVKLVERRTGSGLADSDPVVAPGPSEPPEPLEPSVAVLHAASPPVSTSSAAASVVRRCAERR